VLSTVHGRELWRGKKLLALYFPLALLKYSQMKNSLPYDPAMIALIELTAASDESMQKSLDIYSDNCSKKRGN
jgi:hypothetical protein